MYALRNVLHSMTSGQARYSRLFIGAELEKFQLHPACVHARLSAS